MAKIAYETAPHSLAEFPPPQIISKVTPFLKWVGGKRQLLIQYDNFFPANFNNYIEPFIGGGAVFFHLYNTGRLTDCKRAILIDSNNELTNCYIKIKEDVMWLIEILGSPKYKNKETVYYKIRAEQPKDGFEKAARVIYLNKTCFNGLYRVNSTGGFNVPFGRYYNPMICDTENLQAVSTALKNVEVMNGDFEQCLKFAKKNDFVYFDPPYQPLNKTSSFTSYTKEAFDEGGQVRLFKVFKELDKKDCKVMLSNSDTPFIRNLYKDFRIETVLAKRAINCKASGRGVINELLILNY